jgi:hypothetical protein
MQHVGRSIFSSRSARFALFSIIFALFVALFCIIFAFRRIKLRVILAVTPRNCHASHGESPIAIWATLSNIYIGRFAQTLNAHNAIRCALGVSIFDLAKGNVSG